MTVILDKGFANEDRLVDIRQELLNPIAVKVASLESKLTTIEGEVKGAFTGVDKDLDAKEIMFTTSDPNHSPVVSLDGMFREGSDLELVDGKGTSYKDVAKIHFTDSETVQTTKGEVEVHYPWDKIVTANQDKLVIGKAGTITTRTPKALYFKGPSITVTDTTDEITTVEVPKIPDQMVATISSANTPVPINSIELDGNIGTSIIKDGKLTIDLPTGGSGVLSSDNFKGFFGSLGDIISQVTDPKDGKSFAFALDSKYGGQYYTPYFYVNGTWAELKQDPALLYSGTSSATPQGVFSIKPSDKIQIDSNGQLDLDGLSTPQLPNYFVGFYNSLDELKVEVPRPITYQSFAFVKGPGGGWLNYRADMQGSASLWRVVAPLGSFSFVDENASSYSQVFGINKSDSWEVTSRGLLTLKPIASNIKAEVVDYKGDLVKGSFDTINFPSGKSYANIQNNRLTLQHPQQVIEYNSTWEAAHNTQDYRGNIFFDTTSRCWMGWSDPSAQGAVGAKWTRIAHEDMSVEVKGISRRVPWKTPEVIPGTDKDNGRWYHNGFTFVPRDESNLPDSFRERAGAYIMTMAKGNEDDKFAAERYQVCYSDEDVSETYIRRLKPGSPGAELDWSPWLRTSFSKKDITDHENDPAAHKNVIKYHKVTSFTAKYSDFVNQTGDGGNSSVRGDNCDLICDNYGYTEGTDYIEVPYTGKFRISGGLAFSGYSTKAVTQTQWTVIFSIKTAADPTSVTLLKSYRYVHTPTNEKYPPLEYLMEDVEIKEGDKVYMNIRSSDPNAVKTSHPNLYFVPIKSYIVAEDMNTRAGSKIGATYRKQLGNLNSYGNIEVKAHHTDYDVAKSVRVYGDKISKTSTMMTSS